MGHSALRFRLGATVLVASFCAPVLIPLVASSGLSAAWKTALSGRDRAACSIYTMHSM